MNELQVRMRTVRRAFLMGTVDDENPIALLRGNRYVLEDIMALVEKPEYDAFYKEHIRRDQVAYMVWPRPYRFTSFSQWPTMSHPVTFPPPRNININMMPIKLDWNVHEDLPNDCKPYGDMIRRHCLLGRISNRIGYLTIQEGWVMPGETQRRSGVHIERPGGVKMNGQWHPANTPEYGWIAWGRGSWGEDGLPEDGIFMASTVSDTCAIWPVLIDQPSDVCDEHGGLEHVRHLLGEPQNLQANEMCWFTDRTPHESLPIASDTPVYRQFFRLVVGPISVWYSQHNTPNPLGIAPNAPISYDNKFE